MKNSKKDWNNKLKLDNIDWAEVIEALETTTGFKEADIKKAFKKTGRSFNNNGPFHTTVRRFIEALRGCVKTEMINGEKVYTITSVEDALNLVSHKKKVSKPVEELGPKQRSAGLGTALGLASAAELPKTIETEKPEEDKIKDLFNRSYTRLSETICLLAIYLKHETKELSGEIMQAELTELGVNWGTYMKLGRPASQEILNRLGYFTFTIKKIYKGSIWKLEGEMEVLNAFIKLEEIYEKLSGGKHKSLDDFVSSDKAAVPVKKEKPAALQKFEELVEESKKTTRPENEEIRWKKWLLLEALRHRQGATSKISSLVSWIKSARHEDIEERDALKLYRELQEDYRQYISFHPGDCVSISLDGKIVYKHYDPRGIKETVYIKLKLGPEETKMFFPDLEFKVDEAIGEGKYLYEVTLDRSYKTEVCLKKLIQFMRIQGKLYSTESFMIKRAIKSLDIDESLMRQRDNEIKILENF